MDTDLDGYEFEEWRKPRLRRVIDFGGSRPLPRGFRLGDFALGTAPQSDPGAGIEKLFDRTEVVLVEFDLFRGTK